MDQPLNVAPVPVRESTHFAFSFASRVTDIIVAASSIVFLWNNVFKEWSNNGKVEHGSHVFALITFIAIGIIVLYRAFAPLFQAKIMIPLYSADTIAEPSMVNNIIAGFANYQKVRSFADRIKHNFFRPSWSIDIAESVNTILMTFYGTCEKIYLKLQDIENAIANSNIGIATINARLTHAEVDISEMNGRLTNVEERLTNVEERLTNVEERLTNVETKVSEMNDRLTNVEERLTNVEYQVAELRTEMRAGFAELKQMIMNLQPRV